jgi:hypothetical protein
MTFNYAAFSPLASFSGGLLLGLAATLFFLLNGRILGISGILGGALSAPKSDRLWRILFISGLLASPVLLRIIKANWVFSLANSDIGLPTLIMAGLLVGFGTRYGSGCTSGHGICGISRLSIRSIVATVTFMSAGVCTVYIVRHAFIGVFQ